MKACTATEFGAGGQRPCGQRAVWIVTYDDGTQYFRCEEHKTRGNHAVRPLAVCEACDGTGLAKKAASSAEGLQVSTLQMFACGAHPMIQMQDNCPWCVIERWKTALTAISAYEPGTFRTLAEEIAIYEIAKGALHEHPVP